MKILMIAPTPFFADRGCHTRIYGEAHFLQKIGHEVLLCTYGLGRDIGDIKTSRCFNFPWYHKLSAGPSITKIFLIPFMAANAAKQIRRFKPDVVHAFLHEGAFIARFCRLFYRKPTYFFDLQGSLTGELEAHRFIKKGSLIYKFFAWLEKRINSWFPIITQSDNLYSRLIESGVDEGRVINALDGIDTELFSPRLPDKELADKHGISLEHPRVLFMGLLEQYQGADVMFEAFAKIAAKKQDVQFIVIGYPNIERYKEVCGKLGISENTKFLGKVDFEKAPDYLSLSSIGVAPKISLNEGDGKIYSYMAMGMATVAFDRNVSREILGEKCGLFAEMGDSDSLADRILTLIENEELRHSLGDNARKRAVELLSYEKSAEKIDGFYKRFVQNEAE